MVGISYEGCPASISLARNLKAGEAGMKKIGLLVSKKLEAVGSNEAPVILVIPNLMGHTGS